ncbi:unnamed protein product [Prorocentrum cordatum]|uniref:Uncharacterized protein n=1 Tax=Prorocentrum cordatum TaxID=2364126 RepID=A0ABN9QKX4_9DINO|nr:unnamed protein product [Polarella glacialis]
MSGPSADIIKKRCAAKAEVGEGGAEPGEAEPTGVSRKDKLMTKLLLQHEDNFRGSARDRNAVVKLKTGSQMQLALAAGIQNYQRVEKEARAAVEPTEHRGHPRGKKPDAHLRMLLFRLSEAIEGRFEDVRAAVAIGPRSAELKEALRLAVEFGKSLNDKEVKLTATRCFDVRTKTDVEGKTVEETKWAFAAMSHPPLTQAMCCLKGGGGPQSANAVLEGDSAPRSKAAKEMVPQRCFRRCRPASRSSREGCRISSSGRRRTTARSRAGTPSPGRSRPSNSWRSSGTRPRAKRPGVAAPVLHLPLPLPLPRSARRHAPSGRRARVSGPRRGRAS